MEPQNRDRLDVCPCCGTEDCRAYRFHLAQIERRLAALEEQNARLTASARAFADLADRLNARLRDDRARDAERAFKKTGRQVGFGRER